MGVVVIVTLLVKRSLENPKRPWQIWSVLAAALHPTRVLALTLAFRLLLYVGLPPAVFSLGLYMVLRCCFARALDNSKQFLGQVSGHSP